ncbi:MAG: hypothetical protein IM333_13435 [Microcystis sp. M048S1]|uniref:hypothetical protein n=2 Tax=Microcystaceae TaxID=1890449 RepID=UPI001190160B|nr:hypothetical protein [Microcystis sp. M176S2]MCA2727273.1 hypothetical protein [Microcystis sp. M166S2]MCA2729634.1 hypothetical protein [Microcystis sp. M162S2]MCA2748809.1 hypothetical protein [Microcystis sp. M155S2]MCA2768902.1 hypothetical protein [Microcystis sp. M152S2]MCA2777064.1 hypothetical protein [Microcystis sp. M135S2]MCA2780921.1 hypothetical protein [Microcystis sp. M136S2]MCA2785820.1 hypothetical protein [Microcystis sp. M125S2]MCA2791626.1 hypothetical protein [Microc
MAMNKLIEIRCPNCGSVAQRLLSDRLPAGYKCPARQVAQTECPVCDYFIAMCWQNGAVLEAYAPGIQGNTAAATPSQPKSASAHWPWSSLLTVALSPQESRKLLSGQP